MDLSAPERLRARPDTSPSLPSEHRDGRLPDVRRHRSATRRTALSPFCCIAICAYVSAIILNYLTHGNLFVQTKRDGRVTRRDSVRIKLSKQPIRRIPDGSIQSRRHALDVRRGSTCKRLRHGQLKPGAPRRTLQLPGWRRSPGLPMKKSAARSPPMPETPISRPLPVRHPDAPRPWCSGSSSPTARPAPPPWRHTHTASATRPRRTGTRCRARPVPTPPRRTG